MVERTVSERLMDEGHPSMIGNSVIASPDCRRVAYVARVGKRRVVVVDGQEGRYYDDIVAPPKSAGIIFDSPNQLHYKARWDNAFYLVEERVTYPVRLRPFYWWQLPACDYYPEL